MNSKNTNMQDPLNTIKQDILTDIRFLQNQGMLSNSDYKVIENQIRISLDGFLRANTIFESDDSSKQIVLSALLDDLILSIEEVCEKAIFRKGPKALLWFKLRRTQHKLLRKWVSNSDKDKDKTIKIVSDTLQAYILTVFDERSKNKEVVREIKRLVIGFEYVMDQALRKIIEEG